jgi:hypothetical protein
MEDCERQRAFFLDRRGHSGGVLAADSFGLRRLDAALFLSPSRRPLQEGCHGLVPWCLTLVIYGGKRRRKKASRQRS